MPPHMHRPFTSAAQTDKLNSAPALGGRLEKVGEECYTAGVFCQTHYAAVHRRKTKCANDRGGPLYIRDNFPNALPAFTLDTSVYMEFL